MILPTIDQTEGIWITRTNDEGYHLIQEVFPTDTEIDHAHQDNCLWLIQSGSLQPEHPDQTPCAHRRWNLRERYCRKPL